MLGCGCRGERPDLRCRNNPVERLVLNSHPSFKLTGGQEHIIDIEKTGPFKPDIDKSSLHAGQDPDNPAAVDIADQILFGRPFKVEFKQIAAVNQGHPVLIRRCIDENVCVHEQFHAAMMTTP